MTREKVKATDAEQSILISRHQAAQEAMRAARQAQLLSNEQFTLFCDARGLPRGSRLVGAEKGYVLIDVPRNGRGKKAGGGK